MSSVPRPHRASGPGRHLRPRTVARRSAIAFTAGAAAISLALTGCSSGDAKPDADARAVTVSNQWIKAADSGMSSAFAEFANGGARTWLTEPGTPGTSGSATVWMESTASTSGATSATWVSTCGSEVSATIKRFGCERAEPLGPQPDLLLRLLRGDEQHPSRRPPPSARAPGA